jgi:hypothetical protein
MPLLCLSDDRQSLGVTSAKVVVGQELLIDGSEDVANGNDCIIHSFAQSLVRVTSCVLNCYTLPLQNALQLSDNITVHGQ